MINWRKQDFILNADWFKCLLLKKIDYLVSTYLYDRPFVVLNVKASLIKESFLPLSVLLVFVQELSTTKPV